MNQIKKRLEIIKLAIFMTDAETIKLQLLKLEPFEDDEQINEIISLLRQKQYGQAQALIDLYNEEEIKSIYEDPKLQTEEDSIEDIRHTLSLSKPLDDEFQLFKNHHARISPQSNTNDNNIYPTQQYAFANINFDQSDDKIIKIQIDKDKETVNTYGSNLIQEMQNNDIDNQFISPIEGNNMDTQTYKINDLENNTKEQDEQDKEILTDKTKSHDTKQYSAIPDIISNFQNMALSYLDKEINVFHKSVTSWMEHIAKIGYTDKGIFNMLTYMQKLKNLKNHDEASQLAIVFGATNSNFGKLIFARELYKGELLKKDDNKAFELIKELASQNCAEALCDLGQFYEHGIGTQKDIKQAEFCYKQAIELNLDRAQNLYHKIRKNKKGFFSFLFRNEDNML
ncbi:MAG: sel1 repeat family protein [Campylobacterales bacterium]|nr:sel1 repeat family protein [Campylobacterales bacterium]